MRNINLSFKSSLVWGVMLSALALSACGSSSNNAPDKRYKVSVTNMTANQPLSPIAIIIHKPSYHLFQVGQAATPGLENLAEGGSNQQILDEANANDAFVSSQSGVAPIGPGGSETVELLVAANVNDFYISVAAMLVNTNDGFAATVSNKINGLEKGESFSMHMPVWDAGTEANSEAAGTLPGPADGGEGFNASREGDSNFVAIHQGVVTSADGLATSILGESHRFNNPGALLSVERVE